MKKITALFLALVMTLSLCTVTAFADTTIDNVTLTCKKLSIAELKGLTTESKISDLVNITTPTNLQSYIDDTASNSIIYCWNENTYLGGYTFSTHSWDTTFDFDNVTKVNILFGIGSYPDNLFTDKFNTESGTVTANGVNLEKVDSMDYSESCYATANEGGSLFICITYDVEQTHTVTVDSITHGTVTAKPNTDVASGTDVTLTVTPDNGYKLDSLTVTKKDGGTVEVTDNKFTMPDDDVTVTATFVAKPTPHHHDGGSTTTPTVSAPKTADAGIAIYGVLTVSSLLGIGWVSKRKR